MKPFSTRPMDALAVLNCGGCDAAFETGQALESVNVAPFKSGVALRLPPHSKTLAHLSVIN